MKQNEVKPGKDEILEKLRRYCAFQERCRSQVEEKLIQFKIPASEHFWYIDKLAKESFIDDERYASLFVRSKFNQNQWGKVKIAHELLARGIDRQIVNEALDTLDIEVYTDLLKKLAETKFNSIKETDAFKKKQKLTAFLSSRGFEYELIVQCLKNLKL